MLIEAQTLRIAPLDTTGATDALARRPVAQRTYGTTVELRAQLNYRRYGAQRRDGLSGGIVDHDGFATVLRRDADAASYTPRSGDRIVATVDRDGTEDAINLYVVEARRDGVWGGRHSQWVLMFEDKSPGRKARN
ncbi:MAG: hypothetical protein ACPGQD_04375 [Planctomycetota bacterium]